MQKKVLISALTLDHTVMYSDVGEQAEPHQHGSYQGDDAEVLRCEQASENDAAQYPQSQRQAIKDDNINSALYGFFFQVSVPVLQLLLAQRVFDLSAGGHRVADTPGVKSNSAMVT